MADSIITSEASTNSSQLNPPSRIICRVCQKQFSQYTCPRCNTRYCSLPCYKSHSNRCTESFMRDNVMGEMQQMGPDDDTKQKMLDILKRFHSEEEEADTVEDDDNDFTESSLSEETIQKIMSGLEITFDDLSTEEKKHFQRAVATGQLSKMIEPWDPWWLKPSARTISLSPQGTQLVQPMTPDQDPAAPPSVPPGPTTPLPPISKLTGSTQPSPLLPVHLIDILYSYCFTLRLHNGDWESDAVGSATTAITISNVLSQSGQPETVSESVGRCLEQACGPAFGHMGGARFGAAVLDDVASVLDLGSDGVVCALCDLHRMIEKGVKEMKKGGNLEIKGKLKGGLRKVYFMMCWVHEQGEEVWSSLVGLVRGEKNVVMEYLGNGKGEWKKGERKGKVVIEEV